MSDLELLTLQALKINYSIIGSNEKGNIYFTTANGKDCILTKETQELWKKELNLENITQKEVISQLAEAEKFGPFHPLDCMIIAPITGNSIAKLANGITDNAVLMTAKTTLRNRKPVVLAPFTNDALAMNGVNIMKLLNTKKIFFVPFGQDDPIKKPTSMTSDLSKLNDTVILAINNEEQIQPVIIDKISPSKFKFTCNKY